MLHLRRYVFEVGERIGRFLLSDLEENLCEVIVKGGTIGLRRLQVGLCIFKF